MLRLGAVCSAVEVNTRVSGAVINVFFFFSFSVTLTSALLIQPMETSALGAWKEKSDFFFLPLHVTDGGKAFVMLI